MMVSASSLCENLRSGGNGGGRVVIEVSQEWTWSWKWTCMLHSAVWLNKNLSQQKPLCISSVPSRK